MSLTITSDQIETANAIAANLREAVTGGTEGGAVMNALVTPEQYDAPSNMDPPQPELARAMADGPRLNAVAWLKGMIEFDAWQTPTLAGAWVDYSADAVAQYRRSFDGWCFLRGAVKDGVAPGDLFTLPAAYRPRQAVTLPVSSNSAYGQITIGTDGLVHVDVGNNAWVRLDGVLFRLD